MTFQCFPFLSSYGPVELRKLINAFLSRLLSSVNFGYSSCFIKNNRWNTERKEGILVSYPGGMQLFFCYHIKHFFVMYFFYKNRTEGVMMIDELFVKYCKENVYSFVTFE